jgi:hypothetical protein
MARVVHARLDDETEKTLDELRRRMRLSDSEIVRRAIRSLAGVPTAARGSSVIGIGRFASGVRDLAFHKARLKRFGRR